VVSVLLLLRSPERARFFTVVECAYVVSALKHAGSVSEDETKDRFRWREVIQAAKSPHMWLLVTVFFFDGNVECSIMVLTITPTLASSQPLSPISDMQVAKLN